MVTFDAHFLMLDDVTVGPLMPAESEFSATLLANDPSRNKQKFKTGRYFQYCTAGSKKRVGICCHWNAKRTEDSSFFYHLNGSSVEMRIQSGHWKAELIILAASSAIMKRWRSLNSTRIRITTLV